MSRKSVVLFLIGAACARPSPGEKPHFQVRWTGSNGGNLEGTAVAEWCADRKVLQITLVQGDTGIALALYPKNALGNGMYPVVAPVTAESTPPAAGVAVRWVTQTTVQGFQGDSGRVNLQRSATGRLSGQVEARARSVVDTQRIRLSGNFRDLSVVPDTLGCALADTAVEDLDADDTGADDTGVD